MLDDKATEQGQDQENKKNEDSITREQFETLTRQLELTKKELSSRDSKISEYNKELSTYKQSIEELKNSKLSETEKLNLKLKELEVNWQTEKNERTRATNKAKALEIMQENGIDRRYIDFIPLDDSEAMIDRLNNLSLIAKDTMQEGAKSVIKTLGGSDTPVGGNIPVGKITREQYLTLSPSERDKAFKEGRIIGIGS